MSDLAPTRVAPARTFAFSGIDYAGLFQITLSRHRGITDGSKVTESNSVRLEHLEGDK